jgi:hypothetical protein
VLLGYDDPPRGVFLSMLPVLSFFVWIWVLITVFIHIIRDGDLSGWLNARGQGSGRELTPRLTN